MVCRSQYTSQGFEDSAPPSTCAVLDLWVDSRSYGQHVPGRWSTLAAGGGRRQQRARAHLELCQCQSTQGQGRLSANFHGSKLAAVLFGRGLASSNEELWCIPSQGFLKIRHSRPNRLSSSPSPMCKLHGCDLCCHQGTSCDVECRFGVVQDPNVRANESGFVMPPKERSDGAG